MNQKQNEVMYEMNQNFTNAMCESKLDKNGILRNESENNAEILILKLAN